VTLSEIKAVLAARGLRPLKQLGQNFLHDGNLCRGLAEAVMKDQPAGAAVIEIGPGLGALTRPLLNAGASVVALEKDRGLAAYLRETIQEGPRFRLIEGDALDYVPPGPEKYPVVCGNLPYNISTPLLMAWLSTPEPPERMVFTLQKELVERLSAENNNGDYGALTVSVQAEYEVHLTRVLPPSVFYPQPEVESAVVELRRRTQPLLQGTERLRFQKFVRRGFSQRRKKLSNLLPVEEQRRAQQLSVAEWIRLWRETEGGPVQAQAPSD
jgi:16S rRNA (adenine1518-N6/adenine1519-N6)-dimethyltransferase